MHCMANVPGPLFSHFERCPVCSAEFRQPCDAEVMSHLGMCFESKDGATKFCMYTVYSFVVQIIDNVNIYDMI